MFHAFAQLRCKQGLPTTTRYFSLYKHFVTPNSPKFDQPQQVRFSIPQRSIFSLWWVFPAIATMKRGCLSTSRRVATIIATVTLLWVATHWLAVNSQPWQPRPQFNHDYDTTHITIQPELKFNQDYDSTAIKIPSNNDSTKITIQRHHQDHIPTTITKLPTLRCNSN